MRTILFRAVTVFFITLSAVSWAAENRQEGLFVTHIAIDPKDSETLYVTTTFSVGVLKSTDGGKSWTQINQGFKSFSFTQIAVDPIHSDQIYLADGCAGLYISRNGGRTWIEMNNGLPNTEIGRLVLHPTEEGSAYAVTTQGVYKTERAGEQWLPLNQGDTFTNSFDFISLIALPTHPTTLYLASKQGLYTRKEGDSGWVSVREPLAGKQISALAHDSRTGRLYAAVFRRGTRETLREGGLFVSDDRGKSWSRLGEGLEQNWIRAVLIDQVNSKVLYLATTGRGILKSVDEGRTWKEINVGMTDPNRDIRSLAIDPRDPKTIYAGSYGHWIFQSRDAGATWKSLPIGPHKTAEQIIAVLNEEDELALRNSKIKITPPAAFQKCNQCHGWTDPQINMTRHTLWMVPANRRDWGPTVKRMSQAAGLTPEEEIQITEFLNAYTQGKNVEGTKESPANEIQISVLDGKEEEDPVIAWDGKNYMVVWQTNRKDPDDYNIYGARVSTDGKLLDPQNLPISTAPLTQIFADVAWGKDRYLAVWQDLRSHKRWEVYGARFLPDGTVLDPEGIPIAVGERNARHPQVAWDGQNFFVVWMEENPGSGWDIAGVRISPEGKVIDQERIFLTRAPGDQASPALAWGKDQYLVVWMDQSQGGVARISGARVTPAGKVLDPEGFAVSPSTSRDPGYPSAAWGNGQFVVVWGDQHGPGVKSLSGIRVNSAGKVLDREEFVVASSSNLHTFPSVRCNVDECLVVWEEDQSQGHPMQGIESIIRDVRGAFLDLSRKSVTTRPVMIAPRAVGNHFARVASDGRNYLVVWKDYRTGTAASFGRLLTSP